METSKIDPAENRFQAPCDHLLVFIDEGLEEQPALTQALYWAHALQRNGHDVQITALMSVYNYATEINTMVTGTILNNLRRQLIYESEAWLEEVVGQYVETFAKKSHSDPVAVTINSTVLWNKRGFKAVEEMLAECKTREQPITTIFKSLKTHPVYERLFMQIDEWQLVRISDTPVMLVREPQPLDNVKWLVGVDPHNPEHTDLNAQVLETTYQNQQLLGGEVELIHALPSITEQMRPAFSTYGAGEYLVGTNIEEDEERIQAFVDRYHLKREQLHSQHGSAEEVVNAFAANLDNPIIVLGSRAQPGFSDRLVGHAAERIIEHTEQNVLVIK